MKLIDRAGRYIEGSDWKDFALLKICVLALGVIIGLYVPESKKRPVLIGAAVAFFAAYIPFMVRFLGALTKRPPYADTEM